jgi:hypothetical protein
MLRQKKREGEEQNMLYGPKLLLAATDQNYYVQSITQDLC